MDRNDIRFHMTGHETRLIVGGALLGLALKSKSFKGKLFFGTLGVLTSLGDLVQVNKKTSEKWIADFEKWVLAFAKKHGLEDYKS